MIDTLRLKLQYTADDPSMHLIGTSQCLMFFFLAEQQLEPLDLMEVPPSKDSATALQFTYHSNAQMISILKKTEEQCSDIAKTYSIGRSMEGKELLVIEFSNNPGEHELREYGEAIWVNSASLFSHWCG